MRLTRSLMVFMLLVSAFFSQILVAGEPLWIDVRSAEEFAGGHVPGAINIPHEEIALGVKELGLSSEQTIYLYCGSGRRAGIAWNTLKELGFLNISNVGGLTGAQELFTEVSVSDSGL